MSNSKPFTFYLVRRVLQFIPLIFWVIAINFVIIHLAPGDPVQYLTGELEATVEFQETMRKEFGLDKPLITQLGIYFGKVLRGDFGYSIRYQEPVLRLILSRLPATFLLIGTALLLATTFGTFFGAFFARRATIGENAVTLLSLAGYSMPIFFLGQLLLIVFSFKCGWFPAQGMMSLRVRETGLWAMLDVLRHLVLPAITYATYHLALIFRLTRSKMLETLSQDFIITARAKGLDRRTILFRHALRNAILPVVTLLGVNMGFMLAGSVLTETVFAWPGMGRLMYECIMARDYPVLMGLFIFVSMMVAVGNLLSDIFYALIDPRITY